MEIWNESQMDFERYEIEYVYEWISVFSFRL